VQKQLVNPIDAAMRLMGEACVEGEGGLRGCLVRHRVLLRGPDLLAWVEVLAVQTRPAGDRHGLIV
jgi:hypothetical protein